MRLQTRIAIAIVAAATAALWLVAIAVGNLAVPVLATLLAGG